MKLINKLTFILVSGLLSVALANTTNLTNKNVNIDYLIHHYNASKKNSKDFVLFASYALMGSSEITNAKIKFQEPSDLVLDIPDLQQLDTGDSTQFFMRSLVITKATEKYNHIFESNFWSFENIKKYINNSEAEKITSPGSNEQNEFNSIFKVSLPTPSSKLIKLIGSVPDKLTFKSSKSELKKQAMINLENLTIDSNLEQLLTQGYFIDSKGITHKILKSRFYLQFGYDFNMLFKFASGHFFVIELDSGYLLIIQDQYSHIKNSSISKLNRIPLVNAKSSFVNKFNEEFENNILYTLKIKN